METGTNRSSCRLRLAMLLAVGLAACQADAPPTGPGSQPPRPDTTFVIPVLDREFRGVWIATVGNLDWPSRTTLTAGAQQLELIHLLDRAEQMGANAVVLQVRVNGERLYAGGMEPWATALAGQSDVDPGYDPLRLAIDSAHARGLELHAWFNPFRAGNASDTARLAPTHLARLRPDLRRVPRDRVTGSGVGLWFDPGEPEVHDHTVAVILDVARRYDIDAVHLDDFFYPYPNANGALVFPDDSTYARYQRGGGGLSRGDWRRGNIDRFVERLYTTIRQSAPGVRVGISPFGIWRPGNPAGVTGLDAWAEIYADSRLWLQRGWVDYLAPQLYWAIGSSGQPFPALLDWWLAQNTMGRHIWPGLAAYRVGDGTTSAYPAAEIVNQLAAVRTRGGASGALLFRAALVFENRDRLFDRLVAGPYGRPALPPAATWLDDAAPAVPELDVVDGSTGDASRQVWLSSAAGEPPRWWLVRWRTRAATDSIRWYQRRVRASGGTTALLVPTSVFGARTDGIVAHAVDRAGNVGQPAIWRAP